MDSLDNILYARLSSDIYCLVHNKIVELQRENKKLEEKLYDEVDISTSRLKENKDLKEKNEFLMKRDNKCQLLEQAVKKAIALLTDDNVVADIRRLKPKYNENKYGVERELLDVLKEVE